MDNDKKDWEMTIKNETSGQSITWNFNEEDLERNIETASGMVYRGIRLVKEQEDDGANNIETK